jgi:hypothetical protein
VNGLDIVRMVVSPRPSHSLGVNVVGHYVVAAGEHHLAYGTLPVLLDNFPVNQLPHLGIRAQLAIAARVMRIVDTLDPEVSDPGFLLQRLTTTAVQGPMDRAVFLVPKFHGFLLDVSRIRKTAADSFTEELPLRL